MNPPERMYSALSINERLAQDGVVTSSAPANLDMRVDAKETSRLSLKATSLLGSGPPSSASRSPTPRPSRSQEHRPSWTTWRRNLWVSPRMRWMWMRSEPGAGESCKGC